VHLLHGSHVHCDAVPFDFIIEVVLCLWVVASSRRLVDFWSWRKHLSLYA